MRRWIHPSSFPCRFLRLPPYPRYCQRWSRLSRNVDGIEMERGNITVRKRERERGRESERVSVLALSLFAAIYFMIHTRALTAAGATQASVVLGTVPGRVEKCDILWQMDGGGSWQRCTFKCDCLFCARLLANTNLWCPAGLSLLFLAATFFRRS